MSKVIKDPRVQKALILSNQFGLNEYQTETMVNAAWSLTMEFLNTIISKDEAIDKIIFPYNTVRLNKKMKEIIEQGHYSVMGVGGEEAYWPTLDNPIQYGNNAAFAYSIGISCRKGLSHELFTYGPPEFINEIVSRYPDGNYPTEVIESEWMTVNDKASRLLIIKVSDPGKLIAHYFARISQWLDKDPAEFYLICVSDKNNLLPGEPGYDSE